MAFLLIDLLIGEASDLNLICPWLGMPELRLSTRPAKDSALGTWRSHSAERPSLESRVDDVNLRSAKDNALHLVMRAWRYGREGRVGPYRWGGGTLRLSPPLYALRSAGSNYIRNKTPQNLVALPRTQQKKFLQPCPRRQSVK